MDREWRGDMITPNFTCRSLLALDPFLLWPRALSLCSLKSQAHCYKDGKMSFLHMFSDHFESWSYALFEHFLCVHWIINWHDISKTYPGKLETKHQSFKCNIWSVWSPVLFVLVYVQKNARVCACRWRNTHFCMRFYNIPLIHRW